MRNRRVALMTLLSAAFMLLASSLASVSAQDATPSANGDMPPRPAHIHAGACPDVGDVAFPLEDVSSDAMMGTPAADMMATPDATMMAMQQSVTDVDASLEDILGGEHAINVHESADAIEVYVACGDVTGEADDQGLLTIDLEEQNDSGLSGQAMLQDNGDGTTTVTVMLHSAEDMATPSS